MKSEVLVLAVVSIAAAGCAGHDKAAVRTPSPATLPALLAEPIGCPIYGGDDRPDYDAKGLGCIVDWMRQAQDYLARGGKPTEHTNPAAFERYAKTARTLQARLDKFLAQAGRKAVPAKASPASSESPRETHARAQQAYLSGVVYFQKGDYVRAREEWSRALRLDGANDDAKAGLARLDRLDSGR